eukprot:1223_1
MVSAQSIKNCSFEEWYSNFRKQTAKSVIIHLDPGFVRYLHSDGIILPRECHQTPTSTAGSFDSDSDESSTSDADFDSGPSFGVLVEEINGAIERLGGSVFPKLNWSSPKDASWITCDQTLRCKSAADVITLLKSSTFVAHDLSHAFDTCDDHDASASKHPFVLVLRKWRNYSPCNEFRCFVRNNDIIGVSQRDYTNFYEQLTTDEFKSNFLENLQTFFDEVVRNRFPDPDYVLDIYLDKSDRIWIVDFNPFCPVTDGLLFDWEDLTKSRQPRTESRSLPEFRVLTSRPPVKPSEKSSFGVPEDILEISSAADIDKFVRLFREQNLDGFE